MTLIKKIIFWLIELFKSVFFHKKSDTNKKRKVIKKDTKTKKKADIIMPTDVSLPNFFIVDGEDKDKLIYNISLMKNLLLEENKKIKEKEEKELLKFIQDNYHIKVNEILDKKDLETIVKELPPDDKKSIINKYEVIEKREKDFKIHVNEIDKVINEINKEKISLVEEDAIEEKIDNVVNDKNLSTDIDQKVDNFIKNVREDLNTVDEFFLRDVVREYNKVNYVTLSTMIVDKNYERYKKLTEDFHNHRYNKYYYEREINKIKKELKKVQNLKNKKEVREHINKLKKELYTKSKDKYDLLYNNEVFMNFNKECDLLLDKVNTKVIDIKKEEPKKEKSKKEIEEENKERYLERILLRFQDMSLARKLILDAQTEDAALINNPEVDFISMIDEKYNRGIEEPFNYQRNKRKTELVIFYNELNMAINKEKKEPIISIDHINFRMNDLEEAVEYKKDELRKIYKKDDLFMEDKSKVLVYKNDVKQSDK